MTHGVGQGWCSAFEPSTLEICARFPLRDDRGRPYTPAGVTAGDGYELFVCDPEGRAVHRYTIFGSCRDSLRGVKVLDREPRARVAAISLPAPDRRGVLAEPRAVALDARGNVVVASGGGARVHAVQRFTRDGRYLGSVRAFGCPEETYCGVLGIAHSGHALYVADSGNGAVHVFERGGSFRQVFSTATAPGERSIPVSIALADPGELLVLDRGSTPGLRRFSRSGEFLEEVLDPASLRNPVAVAAQGEGAIHLLDEDGARLRTFTRRGRVVASCNVAALPAVGDRRAESAAWETEDPGSEFAT